MSQAHEDEGLIEEYLSGNDDALSEIVARHIRATHAFALRLTGEPSDAEEIVQESFLKAWKSLKNFDAKKARFKTWLMRIVRNTAIDHLRRAKADISLDYGDEPLALTVHDDAPLPDEIAASKEDQAALEKALGQLSALQRELLLLYNGNDFSFEEIAEIRGESRNTIKSRYRRALEALKKLVHPK